MNKKTKKIISIVALIIVILFVVGMLVEPLMSLR
jgi:hypothetical protein